jgi:hypothetical protein
MNVVDLSTVFEVQPEPESDENTDTSHTHFDAEEK